jgi:hypothetical protein
LDGGFGAWLAAGLFPAPGLGAPPAGLVPLPATVTVIVAVGPASL